MGVVTVPGVLREAVGEVEGMQIHTWDLHDPPPDQDRIEVVVAPPWRAPWITRLAELPALRGLQLGSAGYDHVLRFLPPGVELANAVGVHDSATAEMALALILAAQRDVPDFVRDQPAGLWPGPRQRRSVADRTAVIYGYGGIGQALARRLRACEVRVIAIARRARPGDGVVEQVYPSSYLSQVLPDADILAVATPLTEATRGALDASLLALLPDDALVVNVGRGPVIDTDALVRECSHGRLRAALDVTDPEPLPSEHPLWTTPGVLISPHTAGSTSAFEPRMARFVRSQLAAYQAGGRLPHVVATGAA
ncbi:MAG: NAD(P)-dependent oxidoreductase [Ornithinimicrobium sp.]